MTDGNYWNDRYWPRVLKQRFSRRRLIQLGGLGAAGTMAAAYFGCGSDEETSSPTVATGETPEAVVTPKPGGTITAMANAAFSSWDPALVGSGIDKMGYFNVYERRGLRAA